MCLRSSLCSAGCRANGLSLDDMAAMMQSWANSSGCTLVGIEDLARYSGPVFLGGRPRPGRGVCFVLTIPASLVVDRLWSVKEDENGVVELTAEASGVLNELS